MAYSPDRFDDVPEYTDQRGAHRDHFEGAAAAGAGFRPWLLIALAAVLIGLFVGVALPALQRDGQSAAADATASASVESTAAGQDAAAASASEQRAEESRKAEESRTAEESRKAEESRQAEESRKAEESRQAEESRNAEQSRQAEESRKAQASREAQQSRQAEESRKAQASREAQQSRRAEASREAQQSRRAEESRASRAATAKKNPVVVYNATRVNGLAAGYADRLQKAGFQNVSAQNWRGYGVTGSVVLYNSSSHKATAEAVAKELGLSARQNSNLRLNGVAVVMFR